jgi:outer membrane protein
MRRNSFLTLFVVLFLASSAQAQTRWVDDFLKRYQPSQAAPSDSPTATLVQFVQTGDVPVTLTDVVNLMLDKNLDIRSNRLSPRTSYFQSLIFHRVLQPSISFTGSANRNTSASTSQLNGAAVLSQLTHNFSASFAQNLPTGTTVGATMTMNRQSSNSNNSTFNPSYTGRVTYTASQHILRDRGRVVTLRQIQQAENNEKISETQFELQLVNLVTTAQKAYWDLVFAGEDIKVKQRSLELAQRTLEENRMKVEIGTMAPIDVVQTQSDVASRREQMVLSTYNSTAAEDQIKKLISSDNDPAMFLTRIHASESPRNPLAVEIPTLQEAIKVALENRAELRQSELDLKNKDIDLAYTKNQKLPLFDLTATYTQNGTGGTQTIRAGGIGGQVQNIIPGGIGDALHQLFSYNYGGYGLSFSFVLPLSNKAAEADYSRALNEKDLSNARMTSTAQQIALEVRNALTQAEMNRARIETAQTSKTLAGQRLEAEQTKFNLGTSTLRFVLEEQRNVAQAETNELQATVNLTKSLVDLDRAMGLTLKKNNVEVEKTLQPVYATIRPAVSANDN